MSDPKIPSAERQEMLEQLTHVNLRSVGMLKDALADRCVELLSWALAERDRADTAERELKRWREWDDAEDEWSAATDEAFPTRSGLHEVYATAMAMVSHRQSKGNLVELVNWLLVRIAAAEARANTAEAQCAELTIENLQLAVKAGMMADIPETELRARTAGRIAEVEDKLVATEARERDAVARAERARTDTYAEAVAYLREEATDVVSWPEREWRAIKTMADRIEERAAQPRAVIGEVPDSIMWNEVSGFHAENDCAGICFRFVRVNRSKVRDGDIEVWGDGHVHTFSPTSSLNASEVKVAELKEMLAKARADAFAEVVAWLRKQRDDGRTTNGWPIDPYLGMAFEWLADRIEELGKKGAG